jgi:hypothetical protein
VSEATLKEWRYKGTGLEYVRLGRHVRYPAKALEEWERQREQESLAGAR